MVKKTPAYKNRLKALELERSGGITNKKKSQKNMDKYVVKLIMYSSLCSFLSPVIINLVILLANMCFIFC